MRQDEGTALGLGSSDELGLAEAEDDSPALEDAGGEALEDGGAEGDSTADTTEPTEAVLEAVEDKGGADALLGRAVGLDGLGLLGGEGDGGVLEGATVAVEDDRGGGGGPLKHATMVP